MSFANETFDPAVVSFVVLSMIEVVAPKTFVTCVYAFKRLD